MLSQVREYCNSLGVAPHARILVACSGGVDSMVLAHVLHQLEFHVHIAHVNFKLRSDESDDDQKFVEQMAMENAWPVSTTHFDTRSEASRQKQGIQEAARNLRYAWFDELVEEHKLDFVATGHHLNDQEETVMFQLIRGVGLAGVVGIPAKRDNIIRPLLQQSREAIEAYAEKNSIEYRSDSSNENTDYSRNKIRKEVLPLLKSINPKFGDHLIQASGLLNEALEFSNAQLNYRGKERIALSDITNNDHPTLIIWNWLGSLGFSKGELDMVRHLVRQEVGRQVQSGSFTVSRDREHLVLSEELKIPKPVIISSLPFESEGLRATICRKEDVDFSQGEDVAWLDADGISLPFVIRPWQNGDRFQPLGMEGSQKVSDFLIQQKTPLAGKSVVRVLECRGRIAWILGMRVSEEFKISDSTSAVLRIEILP